MSLLPFEIVNTLVECVAIVAARATWSGSILVHRRRGRGAGASGSGVIGERGVGHYDMTENETS